VGDRNRHAVGCPAWPVAVRRYNAREHQAAPTGGTTAADGATPATFAMANTPNAALARLAVPTRTRVPTPVAIATVTQR